MIGAARFSKIVETVGKLSVHVLWVDPEKDTMLQKAIKANRVMTIHQRPVGTKTDYGNDRIREERFGTSADISKVAEIFRR
jgi:hypothetical protein